MVVFKVSGMLLHLAGLLLHSASATALVTPLERPSLIQPSANLSSTLEQYIHVTKHYDEDTSIEATAMLDIASSSLATFATADYKARRRAFRFVSPETDLVLDVSPGMPERNFQNEAAALCIYKGMEDVIRRRKWRQVEFGCYVEAAKVAIVRLYIEPHIDNVPDSGKADGNTTQTTFDTTVQANDHISSQFHYKSDGDVVPMLDVYITVLNAFKTFQYLLSHSIITAYVVDPGPAWDVSLLFSGQTTRRVFPPFLTYQYVINTLLQLPRYMKQHGRWIELSIDFWDDQAFLGTALLISGKPRYEDLVQAKGAASEA